MDHMIWIIWYLSYDMDHMVLIISYDSYDMDMIHMVWIIWYGTYDLVHIIRSGPGKPVLTCSMLHALIQNIPQNDDKRCSHEDVS